MVIIAGLGNPGAKYLETRHNVGFSVLDLLRNETAGEFQNTNFEYSKRLESEVLQNKGLVLAKPRTFMNSSGNAVSKLVNFYKVKTSDLWVIHDDMDIKIGQYKVQFGKGPKDHNGLLSIYEKLGTKDFWHVRVGIENRRQTSDVRKRTLGEKYVLQNFQKDEIAIIENVVDKVAKSILQSVLSER